MLRKSGKDKMFKDVFQDWIQKNNFGKAYDVSSLEPIWREIVGDMMANRTTKLVLNGNILQIEISVAALKNELLMRKSDLIKSLNEKLNKITISDIKIY